MSESTITLMNQVNNGYTLFNAIKFGIDSERIITVNEKYEIEEIYKTNKEKINLLMYFVCYCELVEKMFEYSKNNMPNIDQSYNNINKLAEEVSKMYDENIAKLAYGVITQMMSEEYDDVPSEFNKMYADTIKEIYNTLSN